MKKVKKAAALLLSLFTVAALGSGLAASAQGSEGGANTPHTIFATFNGDAHSSRGFTWFTDVDHLKSQVKIWTKADRSDAVVVSNTGANTLEGGNSYQVDGGDRAVSTTGETKNADGVSYPSDFGSVNGGLTEYGHKVTVTGLQSAAKYYYEVGDTTADSGMSAVGSFTTEGSGDSFNFIDVSDTQAAYTTGDDYLTNWAPLIKKAFDTVPDAAFVMDNGDITNNGGDLKQWDLFAKDAAGYLMNTTFVPVSGNHETYVASSTNAAINITNGSFTNSSGSHLSGTCGPFQYSFIQHFNLGLPAGEDLSAQTTGSYYDFTYGNALIMVLNTNDLNGDGTLSQAQVDWLARETKNSSAKWKILSFHRAIQSVGSHIADVDVQALRAQLLPIIANDKIDLVLQGHDHTYVRSKEITSAFGGSPVQNPSEITETYNGVSTTFGVNPLGSVYIIPGASDDKFYVDNYTTDPSSAWYTASKNIYPAVMQSGRTLDTDNDSTGNTQAKKPTYAKVELNGDKLVVTTYQLDLASGNQSVLDRYGLAKPDQTALVNQINALPSAGELTVASEPAVKAAYDAYNALDDIEKSAVSNAGVLLNDVKALQKIDPAFMSTAAATAEKSGSNPKTGDSNPLPAALAVLLGAGVVGCAILFRKKSLKAGR